MFLPIGLRWNPTHPGVERVFRRLQELWHIWAAAHWSHDFPAQSADLNSWALLGFLLLFSQALAERLLLLQALKLSQLERLPEAPAELEAAKKADLPPAVVDLQFLLFFRIPSIQTATFPR
jgi:hypothetical protein